jgi:hypothetical protein
MTYKFTPASPNLHPACIVQSWRSAQDASQQGGCMKIKNTNFAKFATFTVLVIGLSASAFASCGSSLSSMAAIVPGQPFAMQQGPHASQPSSGSTSIVGLWYVEYTVEGNVIQTAYQLWNAGGTEVHNPNVDPRGGDVCLGVWTRTPGTNTYTLAHRVWNYDTTGDWLGTINLSETVTVGKGGDSHSGTFALDFYDTSGNFLMEVDGTVTGARISVE